MNGAWHESTLPRINRTVGGCHTSLCFVPSGGMADWDSSLAHADAFGRWNNSWKLIIRSSAQQQYTTAITHNTPLAERMAAGNIGTTCGATASQPAKGVFLRKPSRRRTYAPSMIYGTLGVEKPPQATSWHMAVHAALLSNWAPPQWCERSVPYWNTNKRPGVFIYWNSSE